MQLIVHTLREVQFHTFDTIHIRFINTFKHITHIYTHNLQYYHTLDKKTYHQLFPFSNPKMMIILNPCANFLSIPNLTQLDNG